MSAPGLPEARILIEAARAAMEQVRPSGRDAPGHAREERHQAASRALDRWKPGIDELTDVAGVAAFLGLKGPDSVKRNRYRLRADGTRAMPEPAQVFARVPVWTYRSLVISQAEAPGRGHPGMLRGSDSPGLDAATYDAYLRNGENLEATAKEMGCVSATVANRVERHLAGIELARKDIELARKDAAVYDAYVRSGLKAAARELGISADTAFSVVERHLARIAPRTGKASRT